MNIFLVGLGGFLGSMTRFFMATIIRKKIIGTFIANVSGAIFLAFMFHFYRTELITESVWLFAGIGFSGAYTTFSTFGHETLQLLLNKHYMKAVLYVSSSFTISLLAVFIIL